MQSGWRFRAKHLKGVASTLAGGWNSRWKHGEIAANLLSYRPVICWQEQDLGQESQPGGTVAKIYGTLYSVYNWTNHTLWYIQKCYDIIIIILFALRQLKMISNTIQHNIHT